MGTEWVLRWRYWMSAKPVRPGVYRLKDGGFFVRAKITHPTTKKRIEVIRVIPDVAKAADAQRALDAAVEEESARLRGRTIENTTFPSFAASLAADKALRGKHGSAATRELWGVTIRCYLAPAFGHLYVDRVTREHVDAFVATQAAWIRDGKPAMRPNRRTGEIPKKLIKYAPRTANGHLRILRTICNAMTDRYRLPENPFKGVEFFEEPRAHTREKPNRVKASDVPVFLKAARMYAPQFYAMIVLGFLLGVRPSHMRPLRCSGEESDVKWDEGVLLIRRSNTRTGIVMDRTKTGLDQEVALPDRMMEILRWHQKTQLETKKQKASELLFPAAGGGMRSRNCLDKPFAKISTKIGYRVTPRAMRRTFNNAARGAGLSDVVTMSISGHQTDDMRRHYSHAELEEQRADLDLLLGSMLPKEVG